VDVFIVGLGLLCGRSRDEFVANVFDCARVVSAQQAGLLQRVRVRFGRGRVVREQAHVGVRGARKTHQLVVRISAEA
jgi:hypothetical protein